MAQGLQQFLSSLGNILRTVGIADVLDIAIMTFFIYKALTVLRGSRAAQLIRGIAVLLVASFVAGQLQMRTVSFVLQNLLQFGFIALIVIFQPEIRKALERVGQANPITSFFLRPSSLTGVEREGWKKAIVAICDSAETMAEEHRGALVVIERAQSLSDVIRTGTPVDSAINPEIIGSLFFEGSPLHDGAVVVRDGRIAAAGCLLPLSPNLEIGKEMGTRHRAALGISEQTDSIAVVVSEETGVISVAKGGVLVRRLDRHNLYNILADDLLPPEEEEQRPLHRFFGRRRP